MLSQMLMIVGWSAEMLRIHLLVVQHVALLN
jgi:hypothetical protein